MLKISVPSCFGQPPVTVLLVGCFCARPKRQGDDCLATRGCSVFWGRGYSLMASVGSTQMPSRYKFKDVRAVNRTGSC